MSLDDESRLRLVCSFDEARPAFLAALDQMVSEIRPSMMRLPGFFTESLIHCAAAFSDAELVRDQLIRAQPELVGQVSDAEVADAHLLSICYLFSLTIHEMARNRQELPQ